MKQSVTKDMLDRWQWACLVNTGHPLPVNALYVDSFGYEAPLGVPPIVLLDGQVVRDVLITYDIREVKHGQWLD